VKTLFGRTDLEDALKRLDKLTHDEARTAIAQNLKATHTVDERVRGVAARVVGVDDRVARVENTVTSVNDRVAGVDNRLAGVDERVAGVDERVAGVDDRVADVDNRVKGVDGKVVTVDQRVKAVDSKVAAVADGKQNVLSQSPTMYLSMMYLDAKEGRAITQQTANVVVQVQRLSLVGLIRVSCGSSRDLSDNQWRESIHKWLSPSDPSTNHNIACATHHKRRASWFFQGSIFKEWISTGTLLWIHGKRAPFTSPTQYPLTMCRVLSWLGKERPLVSRISTTVTPVKCF
jgi:archaellum component FlaC